MARNKTFGTKYKSYDLTVDEKKRVAKALKRDATLAWKANAVLRLRREMDIANNNRRPNDTPITYNSLAEKIGCAGTTLSRGLDASLDRELGSGVLYRLCREFGVSMDYITGMSSNKEPMMFKSFEEVEQKTGISKDVVADFQSIADKCNEFIASNDIEIPAELIIKKILESKVFQESLISMVETIAIHATNRPLKMFFIDEDSEEFVEFLEDPDNWETKLKVAKDIYNEIADCMIEGRSFSTKDIRDRLEEYDFKNIDIIIEDIHNLRGVAQQYPEHRNDILHDIKTVLTRQNSGNIRRIINGVIEREELELDEMLTEDVMAELLISEYAYSKCLSAEQEVELGLYKIAQMQEKIYQDVITDYDLNAHINSNVSNVLTNEYGIMKRRLATEDM